MKFVYITTPDTHTAHTIGGMLIDEALAACVNIFPAVESLYRWEGKREQSTEVILIAKCSDGQIQDVIDRVKTMHPHDCPCIVAWDVPLGNPDFLSWVENKA